MIKTILRPLATGAVFIVLLGLSSCLSPVPAVASIDFSLLRDGSYRGSYETSLVKADVEAAVADGRLARLSITRHECGLGKPAEKIVDRVLEKQSLQVDAVSGATYSSRVILKATELALSSARD